MPDFVPLGTVLTLKEGTKRIMVTGRLVKDQSTGHVYDYCAVLWPEGQVEPGKSYMFDHDAIDVVYWLGALGPEEALWREELEKHYHNVK